MKKSLLALAVFGAFAGAASAQSSVTMYGRVDLSIGKNSGESAKYMANGSGSRLGMRGVEDLGGGMKGLFNIEHRFNADTGAASDAARMFGGRSIVGLEGGFGQVVMGREYTTVFLQSQLVADPWGFDTVVAAGAGMQVRYGEILELTTAQIQALPAAVKADLGITAATTANSVAAALGGSTGIFTVGGIGRVRNDSSLTYKIAAGGVTFGAQIAEASDAINNFAKKPVNFAISYAGGPLTLGFGYESTGRITTANSLSGINIGKKETATMFNAAYNFGAFKLGGFLGNGHSALTGVKHRSTALTGTAPLGAGEFRVMFGDLKADGDKVNRVFGLGYHYSLSKRSTIYVDMVNNSADLRKDAGLLVTSKTGYDMGLKHNF
jgi:predicted porin